MAAALSLLGLAFLLGGHLLAVNVASAAPLVAIWCDLREGRRHDRAAGDAGRFLVAASVIGLILGMFLGLGYGVALYSDNFYGFTDAYGRLAGRIQWAISEFAFSIVLLGGVWLWWRLAEERTSIGLRVLRALVLVAAATNLLYHFPPLFALFAKVAMSANSQGTVFSPAELRGQLFQSDVVSRWLHFIFAAVSSAGLTLCIAAARARSRSSEGSSEPLIVAGGRIALVATLAQIPSGMWVLLTLPAAAQGRMLGAEFGASPEGAVGPLLFLFSVLAALGLMHQLAAISFGQTEPRRIVRASAYFIVIVVAMSGSLLSVRDTLGTTAAPAEEKG